LICSNLTLVREGNDFLTLSSISLSENFRSSLGTSLTIIKPSCWPLKLILPPAPIRFCSAEEPACTETTSTSGCCRNSFSAWLITRSVSSIAVPTGSVTLSRIDCWSDSGRNSVFIKGIIATEIMKSATTAPRTYFLFFRASVSNFRYIRRPPSNLASLMAFLLTTSLPLPR
jgi:hypothetical protein